MKIVSISEAREQFSSVVKLAKQGQDDIVIQNRGRSEVVIISYADYKMLQEARENERRKQAIKELQKIAQEVGARNREMTDEEVEATADEITREAIDSLAKQGKVAFQG